MKRNTAKAVKAEIEKRERRKYAYGSVYRLAAVSEVLDTWCVYGDGVMLGAPTTFEVALAAFDALTEGA